MTPFLSLWQGGLRLTDARLPGLLQHFRMTLGTDRDLVDSSEI